MSDRQNSSGRQIAQVERVIRTVIEPGGTAAGGEELRESTEVRLRLAAKHHSAASGITGDVRCGEPESTVCVAGRARAVLRRRVVEVQRSRVGERRAGGVRAREWIAGSGVETSSVRETLAHGDGESAGDIAGMSGNARRKQGSSRKDCS